MGDLRNVTQFIFVDEAVAGGHTLTSEWYGAEDLNGCQFFTSYSAVASPTVNLQVELSCVSPVNARKWTYTDWSEVFTLEASASELPHFIAPPEEMDRPFGSFRVIATTDVAITDFKLAVCRHGLG